MLIRREELCSFFPIVRSTIGHCILFYCDIVVKTLKNTGPYDRAKLTCCGHSEQLSRGQDAKQNHKKLK